MMEQLFQTAREEGLEINDDRFAQLLDDRDPLKFLRGQFHVPTVSEVLDNKVTEGAFVRSLNRNLGQQSITLLTGYDRPCRCHNYPSTYYPKVFPPCWVRVRFVTASTALWSLLGARDLD